MQWLRFNGINWRLKIKFLREILMKFAALNSIVYLNACNPNKI
jgi:hypothetical protein